MGFMLQRKESPCSGREDVEQNFKEEEHLETGASLVQLKEVLVQEK
jgi:hypothetical protein